VKTLVLDKTGTITHPEPTVAADYANTKKSRKKQARK